MIEKQVKEKEKIRNSFFDLAFRIFGISFEPWYQKGYWTEKYIPYAYIDRSKVAANVSVNIIDVVWQKKNKRFLQIGTVMSDPLYRNQGLVRRLVEEILLDWEEKCDGIYLYANDTVLDFYPKFGFQKAVEYQYQMPVAAGGGDFIPLCLEKASDLELLKRLYLKSNPFSALSMVNNLGLLLFYLSDSMKNCVYYSKRHQTICVCDYTEKELICYDIFGEPDADLSSLLSELAKPQTQTAVLGFTPKDRRLFTCAPIDGEDTLFVYPEKENPFQNHFICMPWLSHA